MSLIDTLKSDLNGSLKSGEAQRAETLRGLLSSIHNEEIAKRTKGGDSELSEEEVIGVLQKEAKKRREAIEIYGKAGRGDLEDKEKKELDLIGLYLPPQLERAEIENIVSKVISGSDEGFGQVMGKVMKEVSGRADSKVVSEIVKEKLNQKE